MMTKIKTDRIGIIFDQKFKTFKELQEEFMEENQVPEFPTKTLIDMKMFMKN
jgi:hypothetical protein